LSAGAAPARRPAPSWRYPAALATAGAGVLTLLSTVSPTVPWRERVLDSFEPGSAQAAAHAVGLVGAIALLLLAWGIARARRPAGPAAVIVLGVLVVVHLSKGLDYEEAGLALGLALVLRIALRSTARGAEAPRGVLAAMLVIGALCASYTLAVISLLVTGHGLGISTALARGAAALTGGKVRLASEGMQDALHVLVALAIVGSVAFMRALLAPRRAQDGHDAEDHERAAGIVAAHARDSIAPFVLRADKAFFFAAGGVVAYRVLRETAVVSGDPVGPPASAPAIMEAFLAFARGRGWDVVAMAAGDEHLAGYRGLGLRTMRLGSEAVVDPQAFDLRGRAKRTVRKAVHRVEKHGWTIELVPAAQLTTAQVAEIDAVECAWREGRPRLYGYAMAMDRLWGAQEDAGDLYVLGRAPWGEVRAFQRYVPYVRGLSLDAMRRLDDEPNGISDALVAAALQRARELGCDEVSLNFSTFAHLMSADAEGHRLARWALKPLHRRFQLERLVRFAEKFGPEWRPRHLVYTRQARLPLAALRVMQAEAYVKPPRGRWRPNAWRPLARPTSRPAAPGVAG
jgi:lysyl-tRNA synthetase class 2